MDSPETQWWNKNRTQRQATGRLGYSVAARYSEYAGLELQRHSAMEEIETLPDHDVSQRFRSLDCLSSALNSPSNQCTKVYGDQTKV